MRGTDRQTERTVVVVDNVLVPCTSVRVCVCVCVPATTNISMFMDEISDAIRHLTDAAAVPRVASSSCVWSVRSVVARFMSH